MKNIPTGEIQIEKLLGKRLKALGVFYWKFTVPGVPGVPDRLILWKGRDGKPKVDFLELKTDTGVLSPHQKMIIAKLRSMGFTVHITYGWDEAEEYYNKVKDTIYTGQKDIYVGRGLYSARDITETRRIN